MTRLIDLSHALSADTPPFPGDPPVETTMLDRTKQSDMQPREHLNCGQLSTCIHCGTHLDAPFHFFGNGRTIDQIDLDTCVGEATVLDLRPCLEHQPIGLDELKPLRSMVAANHRILLLTGWDSHWTHPSYFVDHPYLTAEGAVFLVEMGVRLVGVDFPSVDHAPHEAHLQLLGSDVVILENLTRLDSIGAPTCELIAIPMAIEGMDGSPVRAVARVGVEKK